MFLLARTFLFYKRCACNCFNSGYEAVKTSALLLSVSSVFLRNIFDGVTQTCDNFPLVIIMPEFSSDTVRYYTFCNFQKYVQCPLDIATGLRQQGWGRYSQRGRYFWFLLKEIWLKKVTFSTSNHKPLDIATSKRVDGCYLLHRGRILRSL